MNINELKTKVGECDYTLAFRDANGVIKRIEKVHVSKKTKLVILGSPRSKDGEPETAEII